MWYKNRLYIEWLLIPRCMSEPCNTYSPLAMSSVIPMKQITVTKGWTFCNEELCVASGNAKSAATRGVVIL